MIIGTCVVTNADQRTRLYIEGKAPVLREKDILTPATADTPAKRIYLAVQLMYIGESTHALQTRLLQPCQRHRRGGAVDDGACRRDQQRAVNRLAL